jgi:DNA-binding transcriptional regulator YdaS (Cro superfamily)
MAKSLEQQKVAGLERAIESAGGVTALSDLLKCHQTVVSQWKRRKQIPAEWVLTIEGVTGVPSYELRPDLYRKPQAVV